MDDTRVSDDRVPTTRPGGLSDGARQWIDTVLLILLGAVAARSVLRAGLMEDPDIWWHLRTGAWILQHGAIPHTDVLSSATPGQPWVAYAWLFDVLAAKLFAVFSYRGILSLTAALVVLRMAALTMLLARYTRPVRAMILATAAHIALLPMTICRPWLFTVLFFTLELWLLLEACERAQRRWLYPIVPLMLVWADVHIQFVYGLALIGLFAVHQSIHGEPAGLFPAPDQRRRLPAGWLWALLGVSSLAVLANPYGWQLYRVVYGLATQKAPLRFVQDLQSPQFREPVQWIALALLCLGWFAAGSARSRSLLSIALMAASTWCWFRSQRDIWFPVIIASLIVARWWQEGERDSTLGWRRWVIGIACSLVFALPIAGLGFSDAGIPELVRQRYPERACDFIESHGLRGPLYNTFNWGGYLRWRLPAMPIAIDGRTNLYSDEYLMRAVFTSSGRPDWYEDRELMRAKTILCERDSALVAVLRASGRFRVAYEDDVAVVLQPAP